MLRVLTVSLCTVLLVFTSQLFPQQQQLQAKRLLFIGNSLTYTNNLPLLVQELFTAVKLPKPYVEALTLPDASLGDHWQLPATRERMVKNKWDYIILQQGPSSQAASQQEFRRDMETIKPWLKQSGARPALFMVWPDSKRVRFFPQVRQAYAYAARQVDGLFLPAGLALQYVLEKEPRVSLFSDGLHPTPVGSYLAAVVITSKLTEVPPDQFPSTLTWARQYSIRLSPAEHQFCIQAVKAALKDEGK